MKRKILKMPVWLFITICVVLSIFIAIGVTIAIIAYKFHQAPDPTIVNTDVKVESVEFLNDGPIIMDVNDEYQLGYKILPINAKNKNATFTSSDEAIVTVSESGLVKALASGNANVIITTQDGNMTDSIVIVVKMEQIIKNLDDEINASINSISFNSEIQPIIIRNPEDDNLTQLVVPIKI